MHSVESARSGQVVVDEISYELEIEIVGGRWLNGCWALLMVLLLILSSHQYHSSVLHSIKNYYRQLCSPWMVCCSLSPLSLFMENIASAAGQQRVLGRPSSRSRGPPKGGRNWRPVRLSMPSLRHHGHETGPATIEQSLGGPMIGSRRRCLGMTVGEKSSEGKQVPVWSEPR